MLYLKKTPWILKKLYPDRVWKMNTTENILYLTFDDGPHPEITLFVLDQLKKISDEWLLAFEKEELVLQLIPKAIRVQVYKAILDSHASEHGARMTAMDKATENAGDLLKALKLSYNQARQAAITTELTEIVSGAAALSNG